MITTNQTIIYFGNGTLGTRGDILINRQDEKDTKAVIGLSNIPKSNVGDKLETDDDILDDEVLLVFENKNSINNLISDLQKLYDNFDKKIEEKEYEESK